MWIPQLISCGIHMIMVRAAVRRGRAALPHGQPGQNGHARPGVKAGSAFRQLIWFNGAGPITLAR
jgi:hypothetical protein